MERFDHSDPWTQRKKEIDPWDSDWRRKRERQLEGKIGGALTPDSLSNILGLNKKVDCAFGSSAHHTHEKQAHSSHPFTAKKIVPIVVIALTAVVILAILFDMLAFDFGLGFFAPLAILFSLLLNAAPIFFVIGVAAWGLRKSSANGKTKR